MTTQADVVYKAVADFASLRKNIKEVRQEIAALRAEEAAFNESQGQSTKAANYTKLSDSINKVGNAQKQASQETESSTKAIDKSTKAYDRFREMQIQVAKVYSKSTAETKRAEKAQKDFEASGKKVSATIRTTGRDVEVYGRSFDRAGASVKSFVRAHDGTQADVKRTTAILRSSISTVSSYGASLDRAAKSAEALSKPQGGLRGFISGLGARLRVISGSPAGGGSGAGSGSGSGDGGRFDQFANKAADGGKKLLGIFGALANVWVLAATAAGPLIAALGALGSAALGAIGSLVNLSALSLTLPGIFAATALSIGTLITAFRGVGGAFKAFSAEQKNSAANIKATAAAQVAAVRSVRALRDAQENLALTQAKVAQEQIDSLQAIKDAQRDLARTTVNVERARVDAAERVVDADHDLEKAQRDVITTQEDLTTAREDAIKTLQKLRREVTAGVVSEEQAVADVAKAIEEYNKVLASPTSTAADQAQALARLHEAQQRVIDVQNKNTDTQEQLNKAEKKGIEGSDQVVAAKDKIIEAEKNLREAREEAQRSREDQQRQAVDGPRQIADAERALSDAIKERAKVQNNALNGIRDAQERLSNAQQDAAASQDGLTATQQAYIAALDKLSPSAKKFVQTITGMKQAFTDVRKAVQEAFFSKFVNSLGLVNGVLPDVQKNLVKVSGALGKVALQFLKFLTGREAKKFFDALSTSTAGIIKILGPAAIRIISAFFTIIEISLPFIERMAKALDVASKKLQDFTNSAKGASAIKGALDAGFNSANNLGKALGNIIGAFGSLMIAAQPFINWLEVGLVNATQRFQDFADAQKLDGSPFKTYLENVKPLLQEIGHTLKDITGYLFGQSADPKNIKTAIDLFHKLRTELGPAIAKLLDALRDKHVLEKVIAALTDFVNLITTLVQKSGGFGVFLAVLGGFFRVLDNIVKLLGHIPGFFPLLGVALGTIAASMVLMAGLKFTGVLALLRALKAGVVAKSLLVGLKTLFGGGAAAAEGAGAGAAAAGAGAAGAGEGAGAAGAGAAGAGGRAARLLRRVKLPRGLKAGGPAIIAGSIAGTVIGDKIGGRGGRTLADAATGAGIGATVGSIVPVVGTGIGAAVGAGVGAAVANFDKIKAAATGTINFFKGPFVNGLKSAFKGTVDFFTAVPGKIKNAIGDLGGALKDKFTSGFSTVSNFVTGKISDIAGKFIGFGSKIANAAGDLGKTIQDKFGPAFDRIKNLASNVVSSAIASVTSLPSQIVSAGKNLLGKIPVIGGLFGGGGGNSNGGAKGNIDNVVQAIDFRGINTVNAIYAMMRNNALWQKAILDVLNRGARHAEGGLVSGGTPGKDSVHGLLMPGEIVMKKTSVDKIGKDTLLQANETGELPRFATGGVVGKLGKRVAIGAATAFRKGAGLLEAGNIDIHHRPIAHNKDGSISTVRSITITDDRGRYVLIPTVLRRRHPAANGDTGRVVSNQEAIQRYVESGRQLGIFANNASAERYAISLHEQQAKEYLKAGKNSKGFAAGGLVRNAGINMTLPTQRFSSGGVVSDLSSALNTGNSTNSTINKGFTVENLNIHNPKTERASDSLPNAVRKLSYLNR